MTAPDDLRLLRGDVSPELACDTAGEQATAHADTTMNPPSVDREAGFGEGALPREDMRIDGVDQRSVEVEDQGAHQRQRGPGWPSHDMRAPSTVNPAATKAAKVSLLRMGRPSHSSMSSRRTRRSGSGGSTTA